MILVPGAAPGDVVDAELLQAQATLRARIVRIVEPSPDRVPPPCPHAERCGGCDLMHLSIDAQRRHREELVLQNLARVPGLDGLSAIVRVHHADDTERYRNRIRLGAQSVRGGVVVGYRAPRSHDLIEVDTCLVANPAIEAALPHLSTWLAGSSGSGELTLQIGAGGLPAVALRWKGELAAGVFAGAERHVHAGRWAGAEIWIEGSKEPAVIGDPSGVSRAVDGLPLLTSAGGFTQAHEAMSARLAARVAESVPEAASTLELFCGAGNLTLAIARRTDKLEAVEGDARAIEAARKNLAARELRAKLVCADANHVQIPSSVRVVVLDPPRVGAPDACKRIAVSRARRVVMVSCDPATLARDLGLLQGEGRRWHAVSIDLFEMFPHTSHIETLVVLDRRVETRA